MSLEQSSTPVKEKPPDDNNAETTINKVLSGSELMIVETDSEDSRQNNWQTVKSRGKRDKTRTRSHKRPKLDKEGWARDINSLVNNNIQQKSHIELLETQLMEIKRAHEELKNQNQKLMQWIEAQQNNPHGSDGLRTVNDTTAENTTQIIQPTTTPHANTSTHIASSSHDNTQSQNSHPIILTNASQSPTHSITNTTTHPEQPPPPSQSTDMNTQTSNHANRRVNKNDTDSFTWPPLHTLHRQMNEKKNDARNNTNISINQMNNNKTNSINFTRNKNTQPNNSNIQTNTINITGTKPHTIKKNADLDTWRSLQAMHHRMNETSEMESETEDNTNMNTNQINNNNTNNSKIRSKNTQPNNSNITNTTGSKSLRTNYTQTFKKNKNTLTINVFNKSAKHLREAFIQRLNLRTDQFQFEIVNKNRVRIFVNEAINHEKVVNYLELVERAYFFCHTPEEYKPINFLLKNLHDPSYSETDILEAIDQLNLDLKILRIKRFETVGSRMNNRLPNIWHIQVDPSSKNVSQLLGQRFLLNTAIKFEYLKTQRSIQCKNCQRYHHVSINCHMPYRCVKCIGDHGPGACPLNDPNNPEPDPNRLQCVNCLQFGHPANYRGCPKANEILERRRVSKETSNRAPSTKTTSANLSYSAALSNNLPKGSKNSQNNTNNSRGGASALVFLNSEIGKYLNTDFTTLTHRINKFLLHYRNLSEERKGQALLEFIFEISENSHR